MKIIYNKEEVKFNEKKILNRGRKMHCKCQGDPLTTFHLSM
jgi:hypothetical protein